MKYVVTAMAVESDGTVVGVRDEEVDTEENEIFEMCSSPWEVEDAYERFWNRLNASWEYDFPRGKEKVKVISVERA